MEEVYSVMKKAEPKEECVKCESCGKFPAIDYCHDCKEYICTKCTKAHKSMHVLSKHDVVSIVFLRSTIRKSPPEKLQVVREARCKKHTDEALKLYCQDCHKLVCRDCVLIEHKDHCYVFVADVAPKSKAKIQENSKAVKKLSESLRSVQSLINDSKKMLAKHTSSTMVAIDAAIDKHMAKLAEKKIALKDKVTQMMAEAEEVAIQDKNAELAVGEVESLVEFMNQTLERATDQEILSLEKQMSDQVERVSQLYGNPADKFPVPTIPELMVQSGEEVEEGIETGISIARTDLECAICMEEFRNPVTTKCNHKFCKECLDKALYFDPYCPTCKTSLRTITGKQPLGGTMQYQILPYPLAGYEGFQTIEIHYWIPDGIQGPGHPNPGQPYRGTIRKAYLPNNSEGVEVYKLLWKAFEAKMIFTVGRSSTTGADNVVVSNDIHHKTTPYSGQYGYPDPMYLQRVKEELAAKGIVPDPTL